MFTMYFIIYMNLFGSPFRLGIESVTWRRLICSYKLPLLLRTRGYALRCTPPDNLSTRPSFSNEGHPQPHKI